MNNVSKLEGDAGKKSFRFTITRTGDLTGPSSVRVRTLNGSAKSPKDYVALPPTTVSFGAGVSTRTPYPALLR